MPPMTHKQVVEDMPQAIRDLPRDERGYPVPWFTPFVKGKPDFRFMAPGKKDQAIYNGLCWVCGQPITTSRYAFVVGPMCAINRTSAEPHSHVACARYSAKACPFLARPKMERPSGGRGVLTGDKALAEMTGGVDVTGSMPGIALMRNPGVALVWVTDNASYRQGLELFDMGDPIRCWWYARSRDATREEVVESIDSGLPALLELALQDGEEAVDELNRRRTALDALLPAA